jgi:hypothetical protein
MENRKKLSKTIMAKLPKIREKILYFDKEVP